MGCGQRISLRRTVLRIGSPCGRGAPPPPETTTRQRILPRSWSIYAYHTVTLGWCDIAYNALVDKYGQVFEGRAGGITKDVMGSHTGGFNSDVWGVSMIGNFGTSPPDIMIKTVGRLLGWRLGLDHVNPWAACT